ncbi:speckle-type POZ [Fusarium pseudoanthophilum]|uniref:Speckle-type POZ n=1 Tax=Fusarium pseudoanthophilum TaxID=48495 RepID=A0A8H5P4L3_9HYPO|nr:speckle-type POZ [Fusarium pseudoanthophilum]
MATQPHSVLLHLMNSGEFSDFSLVCKDQEFKLHQVIVCPQSPVISAALNSGFEETTSKVIKVNEFDVPTVQSMVTFLYTAEYEIAPEPEKATAQHDHDEKKDEGEIASDDGKMSEDPRAPQEIGEKSVYQIVSHLRVNAIADYYGIEKLVKLSTSKIQAILQGHLDFVIIPQVIAEMSIANRDAQIRSVVARATARYIQQLASSQLLRTIDLEHHLTIEILEACGARVQRLQEDYRAAHTLKDKLQTENIERERTRYRLVAKAKNLFALLKSTTKCRNCKKEFGCHIEEPADVAVQQGLATYVLRCRGCGCRHQ